MRELGFIIWTIVEERNERRGGIGRMMLITWEAWIMGLRGREGGLGGGVNDECWIVIPVFVLDWARIVRFARVLYHTEIIFAWTHKLRGEWIV